MKMPTIIRNVPLTGNRFAAVVTLSDGTAYFQVYKYLPSHRGGMYLEHEDVYSERYTVENDKSPECRAIEALEKYQAQEIASQKGKHIWKPRKLMSDKELADRVTEEEDSHET